MSTVKEIKKTGRLGRAAGLVALCGSLIVPLAVCQTATAQNATDQTAQNATDQATAGTLQEVVVTAERRATNLQTTPISVMAISGITLQTEQINDLNSLGQVSPNLVVYTTGAN